MCEECGWENLAIEIEGLLEDHSVDFARDTLESMLEWIVENEHCTERQETAVHNIARYV